MTLKIWFSDPFNDATEVGQIDTFVTDGVTDTYPFVNKPADQVGGTIQYSTTQKNQYNGGFTKTSSDIIINTIPPANLQGVIPAVGAINMAAYDNDDVEGVDNPRIKEEFAWVGDIDDIANYYYVPRPATPGIEIFFVNNITSVTPDLSWVQLACCDAAGDSLTYAATGVSLYTDEIAGFSTLAASAAQSTNTLLVDSATGTFYFIAGDYIYLSPGDPNSEIVQISSISYNTLTLAASLNYNHLEDEPVYTTVRKIALKETVPEDATGNTAANYYNISLKVRATRKQRP